MTIKTAGFRHFPALGLVVALGLSTTLPTLPARAAGGDETPPPQAEVNDMARDLTVVQQNIYSTGPTQASSTSGAALKVMSWVDRSNATYAVGEPVRLFVRTNKDAYVTVLNVGASGRTTVLFPNQYQPNNKVSANRTVEIAPPNSVARITVGGPVGSELIKVVASTNSKPVLSPQQMADAGAFRTFGGAPDELARDLTVTANQSPQGVSAVNKIIRTVAAGPQGAALLPAPAGVLPVAPSAPLYAGQPVMPQQMPQPVPLGNPAYPAYPNAMPMVPGAQPGVVYVATDKQIYRMGEPVTVHITAPQSCYLTLINIPVRGAARVLFPNQAMQNNLVQGNQSLVLPGATGGLAIQATAPGGIENLVAVCSQQPQPVVGSTYDFSQLYPQLGTADAASRDLVLASSPGRPVGSSALGVSGFIVVP